MNRRTAATALATLSTGALLGLAPGTALAAENVDLTVTKSADVQPGEKLTVSGTGADPQAGYYVALCAAGTTSPKGPDCLGDRTQPGTQVWLSNSPGATAKLGADGTFSTELTVLANGTTSTGKAIDCTTTACEVTLFHDHRNGFDTVATVPLKLAAASSSSATSATSATSTPSAGAPADSATTNTAAESEDSSSATGWIIGGVVVVVAAAAAALYVRSRRNVG
ncbi:neocarzinostatin apoprotein domain-containing protein [Rhodococcus sp. X156]|uniref:neocarzinostatin apoprotein domain-containing protein n=1 Tax=Rhodococcus sp. X156 TaxID=2499145 RepID=UPI0013E2EDF9|nr:neocarzinostatin apoprotein domain-containing protein [Rhodococcus sp. X156]